MSIGIQRYVAFVINLKHFSDCSFQNDSAYLQFLQCFFSCGAEIAYDALSGIFPF